VRVTKEKKYMRIPAAFCLFMGTSLIDFGLIAGSGKTLKK
jgi:hypothetical protein